MSRVTVFINRTERIEALEAYRDWLSVPQVAQIATEDCTFRVEYDSETQHSTLVAFDCEDEED